MSEWKEYKISSEDILKGYTRIDLGMEGGWFHVKKVKYYDDKDKYYVVYEGYEETTDGQWNEGEIHVVADKKLDEEDDLRKFNWWLEYDIYIWNEGGGKDE